MWQKGEVSTHRTEDDPCQWDQKRSGSPPTHPEAPALHPQSGPVDQEVGSELPPHSHPPQTPPTGSEGWCSHLVHHKYIARKWTKYQPNTYPGYCKYIQNIPSQFPCNFPTMENSKYFCNVPSGGIAVSQSGNWWEHSKGSQQMCLWCSSMECLRCSLQFPNQWDCNVRSQ